ncbi:hypothetical protein [Paenibacillus sp. y28]|uniref:hypothetical protein n=1 Tax=Paenibacillus sp. y28 TaxID=3129110 RepID=UPI00301B1804
MRQSVREQQLQQTVHRFMHTGPQEALQSGREENTPGTAPAMSSQNRFCQQSRNYGKLT